MLPQAESTGESEWQPLSTITLTDNSRIKHVPHVNWGWMGLEQRL